jgi:exonuclease SbcD
LLHFADAHIDMANYGRHDVITGLPMRVMDFLKSLDQIVDTAISGKVDLVIFSGDAYKDRSPAPTFQREWGKRIMRLSKAAIPTLLLVGNHDLAPALGRAHAMEAFDTLDVPHVRVIDKPSFIAPGTFDNLPVQILAIPWITRSGLMASQDLSASDPMQVFQEIEQRLTELVQQWLDRADSDIPLILAAHASIQGAVYGGERTVMLGTDLVLPGSLVKDPRIDYVALGHIHKAQNLNQDAHPPVIYPGSIERVDFGEAADEKYFVIAEVERGSTRVEWRQLNEIRPFIDRFIRLDSDVGVMDALRAALPPEEQIKGAIVRLVIEYPRNWESYIDEGALRQMTESAFEFHLVKRQQTEVRVRIPGDVTVGSLTPLELLDLYWRAMHTDREDTQQLNALAAQIIQKTNN